MTNDNATPSEDARKRAREVLDSALVELIERMRTKSDETNSILERRLAHALDAYADERVRAERELCVEAIRFYIEGIKDQDVNEHYMDALEDAIRTIELDAEARTEAEGTD